MLFLFFSQRTIDPLGHPGFQEVVDLASYLIKLRPHKMLGENGYILVLTDQEVYELKKMVANLDEKDREPNKYSRNWSRRLSGKKKNVIEKKVRRYCTIC